MSLTKEALELILSNNAELSSALQHGSFGGALALPDAMSVHDLEQYLPGRRQFRATLSTTSIADFVEYCNQQAEGAVFVGDDLTAKAVFDLGTVEKPGHGHHKADLSLEMDPVFKLVSGLESRGRMGQRELAELLEDYHDFISLFAGDEEMNPAKAIAAVRRVTFESKGMAESEVSNYSQKKSAMEQIDAKSGSDPLPSFLSFGVDSTYLGLEGRTFQFRISLGFDNGQQPQFSLRGIRFAEERALIRDEFFERLSTALTNDEMPIYKGSISY